MSERVSKNSPTGLWRIKKKVGAEEEEKEGFL